MLSLTNYDRVLHTLAHGFASNDQSRTVQSQKEEADINYIVKQFGITGKLPQNVRMPTYGDFDVTDDYRTALEAVREAEKSFLAMPSEFRASLGNDPQRFLDFCADEKNLDVLRKYGLAVQLPPQGGSGSDGGTVPGP